MTKEELNDFEKYVIKKMNDLLFTAPELMEWKIQKYANKIRCYIEERI